ncbi:hypothetical protein C8Q74DRAFT_1373266 [Fomes fomentarius]|nr:hypothetical protein C8Q74DRAFT_1373266 [Fomes fomentarius]
MPLPGRVTALSRKPVDGSENRTSAMFTVKDELLISLRASEAIVDCRGLENANRKVDLAQKELWHVSDKAAEVNRKLLEHNAGVYRTENSAMSPTQSSTSSASSNSSRSRFDGAHFFAGHSDAVVPSLPKGPASSAEVTALQEQLTAAQAALDAANAQQQKMSKELSSLQSER